MVVRITGWVLRVCGTLALILGIVFWASSAADALVPVHMLLGLLVTLSLWVLGIAIGMAKGGNWGLGAAAIVWGLIVVGLGLSQQGLLVGSAHWVIQVLHLLVGLVAIGLGEMITGRYRRLRPVATQAART